MAANTPSDGSTIIADRYQLTELVGRGGMADVWMANDLKLHRQVAVKLLNSAMRAKAEVKERFKAEARAAARLNHPHVVAVYDTGEHEGIPFLVMELLSGRTLAEEIEQGPMDQYRVLRLAGQALAGLAAAHEVGIVHRDIKPWNILFTADGESVKVADFGIAKGMEGMDLTRTGTMMGTPAYLAPEQVGGEKATQASDLYSLGVVLYEALTGRPPYEADTMIALANKIHNYEPASLRQVRPDLDPVVAGVVEKAMAKDPQLRFRSAREMAEAVAAALGPSAAMEDDPGSRTMIAPPPAPSSERTQVISRGGTVVAGPDGGRRQGLSGPVRLAIGLSVAALALLVAVVAWQSLNQSSPIRPTPDPTVEITGGSPLPSPLERSLRRLEEAVRP